MAKSGTATADPPVDSDSANSQSNGNGNQASSSPPEVTFRVGRLTASVFINQTKSNGDGDRPRRFRSASVQRSYKDGDKTKFTSSFGLGEIRNAIRVLELAAEHMESKESVWTT